MVLILVFPAERVQIGAILPNILNNFSARFRQKKTFFHLSAVLGVKQIFSNPVLINFTVELRNSFGTYRGKINSKKLNRNSKWFIKYLLQNTQDSKKHSRSADYTFISFEIIGPTLVMYQSFIPLLSHPHLLPAPIHGKYRPQRLPILHSPAIYTALRRHLGW